MRERSLLFLLVLLSSTMARAQGSFPVRNLGASDASFFHGRLVYSLRESFAKRDLNGDGDQADSVVQLEDPSTGEVTNLGLAGSRGKFSGADKFTIDVREAQQGKDLNADGDLEDTVLHLHDVPSETTTNLKLVVGQYDAHKQSERFGVYLVHEGFQGRDLNGDGAVHQVHVIVDLATGEMQIMPFLFQWQWISGSWFVGLAVESPPNADPQDLNGDGDAADHLKYVRDLSTGLGRILEFADPGNRWPYPISGHWLVLEVPEKEQGGEDLNGDGDTEDTIIVVHDLATDTTLDLRLAGRFQGIFGDWLAFQVSEASGGKDLNGDGDTSDIVLHVHDLSRGKTTNVGIAGDILGLQLCRDYQDLASAECRQQSWMPLSVSEGAQGKDLNGDGDSSDQVLHVYDVLQDRTTNLGLTGAPRLVDSRYMTIAVREATQGSDLNGDGDLDDDTAHIYDHASGAVTNLRLAAPWITPFERHVSLLVLEEKQGNQDLNGDGDPLDSVFHIHGLDSGRTTNLGLAGFIHPLFDEWFQIAVLEGAQGGKDLDGDGRADDQVTHFVDFASGKRVNLRIPEFVGLSPPTDSSGDWLLAWLNESIEIKDLNGDDKLEDWVAQLVDVSAAFGSLRFVRGDCDSSGETEGITDPVFLLGHLFLGGPAPPCRASCDADRDGALGITDAVYTLNHFFLGGAPLPSPFPRCAPSSVASDEALGCERPNPCPGQERA